MAAEGTPKSNIIPEYNSASVGLNMDNTPSQIGKGVLTYALNAAVENFDANSVNYQNEPGNEFCLTFPDGYTSIGDHFIPERNKHIFFLVNPEINGSEIGYMDNNDCVYRTLVNDPCLGFDINFPVGDRVVHKITNCGVEIYWTDAKNHRRFMDLDNVPYKLREGTDLCNPIYTNELDCNRLEVQPRFTIPSIEVKDVITGGDLKAGTYQFAIQYSNAQGNGYTSYYSVTNPTPIANTHITTLNFDYEVGKSIILNIGNIDTAGYFQYFNIAVIKTINNITSAELVGTFSIDDSQREVIYTGQNVTSIKLTIQDIFERFPFYEIAGDVTTVQDIIVWDNLTSIDRINYQSIANQINLQWQSYRIPNTENYADELNATNLRGYLRDEVYAFEIVFLLQNGKQTDGFHIPGRISETSDILPLVPDTNPDFIGTTTTGFSPFWKIYNTAYVEGTSPAYTTDPGYKGEYQYGKFSYWESEELYPCDKEVWGELADKPIRHHKFPDVLVSPIFESALFTDASSMVMQNEAIFALGVKIDIQQISSLIAQSSLTQAQKDSIVGFKIIRGDRSTNKSIIGKGILRNVGKYTRDDTDYLYPNYPYNDLGVDPFLLEKSNAYTANANIAGQGSSSMGVCRNFTLYATTDCTIQYIDCYTNTITSQSFLSGTTNNFCANNIPAILTGEAYIKSNTYTTYSIHGILTNFTYVPPANICTGSIPVGYPTWDSYCRDNPGDSCCAAALEPHTILLNGTITVKSLTLPVRVGGSEVYDVIKLEEVGYNVCAPAPLQGFVDESLQNRLIFNSPETSFGQPFLGDVLKLENVMFGAGIAHFTQVKKNSLYRMITKEAQEDALASANAIADITATYDAQVLFAAYQAYLTIYVSGITRRNYGYSFNSIASYDYTNIIENNLGVKQRRLETAQYLIPGVQSVGDNININNYQRESSVYLKTEIPLPFPSRTPSMVDSSGNSVVVDNSRFVLSDVGRGDCNAPGKESPINVIAYYASLKNSFINQWGQIYSYDVVDTGFQVDLRSSNPSTTTFFGGDTFINRFAFKTKLPFFIDNRVGAPDDSDIYYDEIGNVAYPKYWYSSRSVLSDYPIETGNLKNFVSVKAHNLDCPNSQSPDTPANPNPGRTYYDGKMYLFAYGIPSFYCESSINVDLRQAFNNREGDFFPHVSTTIPDDWVQESFVSIANDNTYYYNVTYSKQNRENSFSHLPIDWENQLCFTNFPFRAIYSDPQNADPSNKINNWLTYRAASFFDFPQNFGRLIALDGIQNKAILARFENKSLLYNTLLTINTSNPQAAYLGNDTLFKSSPPIDFADTDLGYVGCQNKMLLKIPQGQITVDAKRGQVFLIAGNQATDLSAFGSGLNRFFTDHLAFEILKYFPDIDTDNNYNGIGLHGVYDSKYDRIILTKIDYIPTTPDLRYDSETKTFFVNKVVGGRDIRIDVYLGDSEYFCSKSWTLSFNFNTKSWISFHSYIPNWYIAENNFFYSGMNDCCSSDIDALVGRPVAYTTTTTTSTSSTSTTTTTTTTIFEDCEFSGEARELDCQLSGTAVEDPCALEGIAENPFGCDCITFTNTTEDPAFGRWKNCVGDLMPFTEIPALGTLQVCGYDPEIDTPGVSASIGDPCFFQDDYVCTTTTSTTLPPQFANWYSMVEDPEYAINTVFAGCAPGLELTLTISSIIINGVEQMSSPEVYALNSGNINIIAATNNVYNACTTTSGYTYTNFVDFLNTVFAGLGLTTYAAQVSLISWQWNPPIPTFRDAGFYIIYPQTDTFTITCTVEQGVTHLNSFKYSHNYIEEKINTNVSYSSTSFYTSLLDRYSPAEGYAAAILQAVPVVGGIAIE